MFAQGIYTEALTELIRGLKADGIWDKTELICVVRGSEIASLTNLKNAADRGTNVGPCIFTPHRGFSTTDTNAPTPGEIPRYIESGKIFSGSMSVNSNHFWTYTNLNYDPSPASMSVYQIAGVLSATGDLFIQAYEAATDVCYGQNGSEYPSIAVEKPKGFFGTTRTSSIFTELRINSTTANSVVANGDTTLPDLSPLIGAIRNFDGTLLGGIVSRVAGWGWGSGLNTTELGNLRTRIQTYMTAIGAQA